jgi:hypothetical protein
VIVSRSDQNKAPETDDLSVSAKVVNFDLSSETGDRRVRKHKSRKKKLMMKPRREWLSRLALENKSRKGKRRDPMVAEIRNQGTFLKLTRRWTRSTETTCIRTQVGI